MKRRLVKNRLKHIVKATQSNTVKCMRRMKTGTVRRLAALMLSAVLSVSLPLSAYAAAGGSEAENNSGTVSIENLNELKRLADRCSSDDYSRGLTVTLAADIDADGESISVPVFLGIFDGQGHKITGLSQTEPQSRTGLFGIIEKGAVVKNLTVEAEIAPDGTQSDIGGIAGENHGTIESCSFSGIASGSTHTGGIAGVNAESGVILDCSAGGTVHGTEATGGIAGKNEGVIMRCVSEASVNTAVSDDDIGEEELTELQDNLYSIIKKENISNNTVTTDTGGIAGLSTGVIQSCINNGAVGYLHAGYNVGGIAGRQRGYIASCKNYGEVKGRKDAGGIVGQMEPDVTLEFSSDDIDEISDELDVLKSLTDKALDDADSSADTVSASFTRISDSAGEAGDLADSLGSQLKDFTNDNIDVINNISLIAERYADRAEPIADDIKDAADDMSDAFDDLRDVLSDTDDIFDYSDDIITAMRKAGKNAESAGDSLTAGAESLEKALAVLKGSPEGELPDTTQLRRDIAALEAASAGFSETAAKALSEYQSSGFVSPETSEQLMSDMNNLLECIKAVESSLADVIKKLDLRALGSQTEENMKKAASYINKALSYFSEASSYMKDAAGDINSSLRSLQYMNRELRDMAERLDDALDGVQAAADDFKDALSEAEDWARDLADEDPGDFTKLGSQFDDDSSALNESLSTINNELSSLNNDLSGISDTLIDDMRAISNQFQKVMDLFENMIDDVKNKDLDDIFEDVSEAELKSATRGKVLECTNYADVKCDRNGGGIAGLMAIEYDYDPEDDLISDDEDRSLNFTYKTRAIIMDCNNYGAVSTRKSCAGGIAGRMDLGTIYGCGGWGDVSSENNDYVGGVCGLSLSSIRNSYAKCFLSGRKHIGGIAGSGDTITDCIAMVQVTDAEQLTGEIAGEVTEEYSRNRFVSDDLAGVDRISLSGKADSISYEALCGMTGIPDEFLKLSVVFKVREDEDDDAEEVKRLELAYGDSLDSGSFPDMADSEDGEYVQWDTTGIYEVTEDAVITGEYQPYETTLSSAAERGERPVLMAEGRFHEGDSMTAEKKSSSAAASIPGEVAEVWSYTLPDDSEASHVMRWQLPSDEARNDAGSLDIYINQDGKWKKVKSETAGSYIVFEAEGTEGMIAAVRSSGSLIKAVCAAAAVAALAAAFALYICKRKKKKQAA